MIDRSHVRHKYAMSCALSCAAGFTAPLNPLLSSLLVARYKEHAGAYNMQMAQAVLPVLAGILFVQWLRGAMRAAVGKLLGGSQRAPLIWLQHRIGVKLGWLEPMLHNWGLPGMLVTRLAGERGLAAQVASSVLFFLTDTGTTVLSGVLYYYTDSYALSLLSMLVLPMLTVVPWAREKNLRIKGSYGRSFRRLTVKKGTLMLQKNRERPPRR